MTRPRTPHDRRDQLDSDLGWIVGLSSPAKRADAVALAVIGDELAALNATLTRIADAIDRLAPPAMTGGVPW